MKKIITLSLFVILLFSQALPQEGMWMLNQIGQLNLKKEGLQLTPDQIFNTQKPSLYNAIVQLGGGSASFVSNEGLLVTNHHVAFTAVQRASTKENDYLANGFLALNNEEEIPAPGYAARVLTEVKDITAILEAETASGKDAMEKNKLREKKIAEIKKGYEEGKKDIEAAVAEMYNGKQYYLYVYKVFNDVRLVYIPPMSIGNYGGEIDNWMWPRHTGDFSFLRVYCSKSGEGAEFSKENIPYKPKVWLKPGKDFLREGDLTFIMGFPGFTTRYRTSTSVEWNLNKNYPSSIKNFKEIIEICESMTKNDREGAIKVSNLVKGLANAMKNFEGKVTAMKRTNFLQKKIDFEKEFLAWVNSTPERKAKYGDVLEREKKLYVPIGKTKERDDMVGNLQGLSGTLSGVAATIVAIVKEKEKPEGERAPGFMEERINETIEELKYQYADYYEPVDKVLFARTLKQIAALPESQRISELDYILKDGPAAIDKFADEAYKNSKIKDEKFAASLFEKSSADLAKLQDPFIDIALRIYDLSDEIREANNRFGVEVTAVRKEYLDALFAWKGMNMYPDANSTMRFTYGRVKGYKPADAVTYAPITTLKGVVEKNTGEDPFDAPEKLVTLHKSKDFGAWKDPSIGDVPIAFTHTCDITGGNSGSPVMNAKGEIVGLAFDGNYEALISDWQYDPELQRTISVSFKYVCFILDKYAGAKHLLKEMGI